MPAIGKLLTEQLMPGCSMLEELLAAVYLHRVPSEFGDRRVAEGVPDVQAKVLEHLHFDRRERFIGILVLVCATVCFVKVFNMLRRGNILLR